MPEQPDHARGEAHGLSLWLTLDGLARARLRDLIAGLASRLGGPVFEPHVTLLPGLAGPEGELRPRAAELAQGLAAHGAPLRGPAAAAPASCAFPCLRAIPIAGPNPAGHGPS